MSLATSVGGGGLGGAMGGAGGLAMVHQANAMAQHQAAQPPPQAHTIPDGGGMGGPPVSSAALGADLIDKNQHLTMSQMKSKQHLPLVGIDIFAKDPIVASFPPRPSEPNQGLQPTLVGKLKSQVNLKKGEVPHKTLRKFLTKDKGYDSLRTDALVAQPCDGLTVTLDAPHKWMGVRRLADVSTFLRESNPHILNDTDSSASSTAMISEDTTDGVQITNGTLDGVSAPSDDDFDRVVYKVRLADNKKALTVLPEEATSLVVAIAQAAVARTNTTQSTDDDILDYPVVVALPSWACHDAAMEAWLDTVDGGIFVQRSVAALTGALMPEQTQVNPVLERVSQITQALAKAHQSKNDGTNFNYDPLLINVGMTPDGVECTATQISTVQTAVPACVYGDFKVLASMSIMSVDPAQQVGNCLRALYEKLDEIAPEVEGPVAFVSYGSTKEQEALKKQLEFARKYLDTWDLVPVIATKPEAVALGTAILGGVSHGRLTTLTEGANKKPKAFLALRVQDVAPTAVGIKMSYTKGQWTEIKTVFDFDRRVPAGPYPIELNAAECAAMRGAKGVMSDEALLQAIKEQEGAKGISKREEAALDFKLQIFQKWSRDGEWIKVGDVMQPLTKDHPDDETKRVACETITLQLSLGSTGIINYSLVGELQSVVQATKSARNSTIRYWVGIILAIAFFGGFMIKSYWEEHVFERDTKRLLAYYKHATPGSANGDVHNARYLVWKYRGKKKALWKRLEVKYGIPVRHAYEWEDEITEQGTEEQIEEVNLDGKPIQDDGDTTSEPEL